MNKKEFSFICDLDGKILTFNKKCQNFFSFSKNNVIGVKRIYNLIHPDFIIFFIEYFNKFKKNNFLLGECNLKILNAFEKSFSLIFFLRKRFGNVYISAFKSNSVICTPKSGFLKRIHIIFRSKFTLGSIMPFIFSIFISVNNFDEYSIYVIFLLFLSLYFFHVSANTFNDYFDWKSNRDKLNVDYVLFSTGGSRSLDLKLISEKHLLMYSLFSLAIVFLCSGFLIFWRGIDILYIGLIAVFCVYFYSAPPIHLASRYGLGELMHIICLGPLITYGSVLALTGYASISDFFIGFPFGFLITCCLLLNEVPDSKFDKMSGKNNLVVVFGIKYIPYLYCLLLLLCFISLFLCVFYFKLSFLYFLILFILPYLSKMFKILFCIESSRLAISEVCVKSFYIYLYFNFYLYFIAFLNLIFLNYPW